MRLGNSTGLDSVAEAPVGASEVIKKATKRARTKMKTVLRLSLLRKNDLAFSSKLKNAKFH